MANNTMESVTNLEDAEIPSSHATLAWKQCPGTQDEPAEDCNGDSCTKEAANVDEASAEESGDGCGSYATVASASTLTEWLEGDEGKGDSDGSADDDEGEEEQSDDGENLEVFDESETRPETSVDMNGHPDNEVERHDAADTKISQEAMTEASRTALFRRYSKMTPTEQERSFHEETLTDLTAMQHSSVCPEPTTQRCQNPACADQIGWRDVRIAELQAALDHMTEAMAIQQRDMASQRVYLSRQAEQLTNLSNKLHQEKVALHVERERFQKSIALTPTSIVNKLKPATGKIKSPVKKIFSAAANRRASFTTVTEISNAVRSVSSASTISLDAANRSNSSSQLRHNPLCNDHPPTPLTDRSVSLSALELKTSSKHHVIAITPPKQSMDRVASPTTFHGADLMVDIRLNDGLSPQKSMASSAPTEPHDATPDNATAMKRTDREESVSSQSSDQKKLSIGDRFRSIRWGRS